MASTANDTFPPPAAAPASVAAAASPGNEASTAASTGVDATKNDNWRFVEPQPVREDQVENAVKFLSHPKVKGSPIMYRRSFLERKGLSKEEIDEAFRRVPDPASDSSTGKLPGTGAQSAPVAAVAAPQQVPASVLQQPQQLVVAQPKSTSWGKMIIALGVLTAAGAGAGVFTQKYFLPKFKLWLRQVVLGESAPVELEKPKKLTPVEEATAQAAAAAAAAATAASQMAGAMQEIAHFRSEDRQRLDNIIKAVEAQTEELKNALAGMKDAGFNSEVAKYTRSLPVSSQANGFDSIDFWKGQTIGSKPSSADKSFKVTNTGPMGEYPNGHYSVGQQVRSVTTSPTSVPTQAPHSQSYMDVIGMLERGEKPPNIREVNDKPPNPNQPPSNPRLQPRPKPWEKGGLDAQPVSPNYKNEAEQQAGKIIENRTITSTVGYNTTVRTEVAATSSETGVSSEPWWRRKTDTQVAPNPAPVKITEFVPDPAPVKITEVESAIVDEVSAAPPSLPSSSLLQPSSGRPGWVPPSVPQPIYPGAQEAIRRPKPAPGASSPSSPPYSVETGSSSGSGSGSASAAAPPPTPPSDAISEGTVSEMPAAVAASTPQLETQPKQANLVPVAPAEAEPEQPTEESSVVEPNRTFKEVVNEE
ncbi:hypothetical protein R1flu_025912 [Riccia fluitans]|uniref:Peroxisomal membrane protein PEX14 n=1 Tax=Riccia fluitans TaxID=41844 RepID=A0ABD1XZ27_9MARC